MKCITWNLKGIVGKASKQMDSIIQFQPDIIAFQEVTLNSIDIIRKILGIWLILIGTVGFLGNLATLITIPYSAKQKRHGLDRNFNTTTIFILHLSCVDLLFYLGQLLQYSC